MSRKRAVWNGTLASFPRVSGDEPGEAMRGYIDRVFSPRERG